MLTNIETADALREDQSYERTDKFNSIGVMMYIYWCLKARIDASVQPEYQHGRFEELEMFTSPLPETVTREFEFEILYPVIADALKGKIGYPLLYDVALEILSYYCRVINSENLQFPGCKVTAAGNGSEIYKLLLQELFEFVGSNQSSEEKRKVCLEIFKKLINIYDATTMEDIVFDMIVESKNDKEKALLVDLYRDVILKANKENEEDISVITQFKDHLKLMFDHHFNTEEYIFDISERIISTLNLWRFLYMIEKQRNEISETAKKLHEKMCMNICEDLSKLIDNLQPGLVSEKEHALSNPNLVEANKKVMEETWNINLAKLDIIREIISIVRSL